MKLFKQDVEFRQAVLAEIVQSQEVQDLLRTEREEAQRHLQSELKQFKETILSEMISSCCTLFQQQVQLPPPLPLHANILCTFQSHAHYFHHSPAGRCAGRQWERGHEDG